MEVLIFIGLVAAAAGFAWEKLQEYEGWVAGRNAYLQAQLREEHAQCRHAEELREAQFAEARAEFERQQQRARLQAERIARQRAGRHIHIDQFGQIFNGEETDIN